MATSALSLVPRAPRVWISHRIRARREAKRALHCDVMVLSRAKSGRTWLRVMLSRLYQRHYGLAASQLLDRGNFHRQEPAVPIVDFSHGHYLRERFVDPGFCGRFQEKKIVFLARHPCDVAVSEYFQSTRRARPHKRELHGVDVELPIFDFVMRAPLGLPAIVEYLNGWAPVLASLENGLVVRYEDFRSRPIETLQQVVDFLAAPFPLAAPFSKEGVAEAVEFASFENLKELERRDFFRSARLAPRDPRDPDSFKVRRGVAGGYTDYFDEQQLAVMDALVQERLTPFYGYAETPNRTVPRSIAWATVAASRPGGGPA